MLHMTYCLYCIVLLCVLCTERADAFSLFRTRTSPTNTISNKRNNREEVHADECVTPLGTILGYANNIPAFSNCHSNFKSTHTSYTRLGHPHDVHDPFDPSITDRFMTGLRYNAQDYVNRWWIHNRGLLSALVERPESIWGVLTLTNPAKVSQHWELVKLLNDEMAQTLDEIKYLVPRVGDCVIYASNNYVDGMAGGHAAMIVKVEDDVVMAHDGSTTKVEGENDNININTHKQEQGTNSSSNVIDRNKHDKTSQKVKSLATMPWSEMKRMRLHPRKVYIAEQNFDNKPWGNHNYSRVLSFTWVDAPLHDGYVGSLRDTQALHIIGRLRIGAMKEELTEDDMYKRGLEAVDNDDDDDQHDL